MGVVFRNYQWGAEKRNTTLWYDDNFVGTELNVGVEYAKLAEACGLVGLKVSTTDELENALASAIEGQMERNETTLIEVILNQELGEPFRRDDESSSAGFSYSQRGYACVNIHFSF